MRNVESAGRRVSRMLLASSSVAAALTLLGWSAPAGAGGGSGPGGGGRTPELGACSELKADAGTRPAFHVYAEGVQIYRWNGSAWAFVAPEAILYAELGARGRGVFGVHYAGPTWEFANGARVVGSVVNRCTPDPDSIPWLLLKAVEAEGPGVFGRIVQLQRLATRGGKAPAVPGSTIGEIARAPYTADYYFYR